MIAENKLVRILKLKKDFQEEVSNCKLEIRKIITKQTSDLKKEAIKLLTDAYFFFEEQESYMKKRNEVMKKIDSIEKESKKKLLTNVAILEAEFNKELLHILDGETFMAVSFDLKNKNEQDAFNIAYILQSNGFFVSLESNDIFKFQMLAVSKDQEKTLSDMIDVLNNAGHKGISFDVKNDVK